MSNVGTKMIIVWLVVDVFLLLAGGISAETEGEMLHHFANTSIDEGDIWYNSTVTPSEEYDDTMGLGGNSSGGEWSSGWISSSTNLGTMALDGLILVAKFFFAPVFYLQAVGAPFPVIMLLGVIPSILFVIAVINWLRGADL